MNCEKSQEGEDEEWREQIDCKQAYCCDSFFDDIVAETEGEPHWVNFWFLNEDADLGQNWDEPYESEAKYEEEQKEHEPADISLSYAVVDPGAVVVILPDANSADLAVVSSFGDGHLALEAIAFYCLLIAIDQ